MSTDGKQKSQLIEIGALWYSTKSPGVMTGKLGNARLGQQPDCHPFVAPFEKREQPQQKNDGDNIPW